MKITRWGAGANHGSRSIDIDKPRFSWNKKEKVVELRKSNIKDFTSGSKHDYVFQITLAEIREILKIIGDEPANSCSDEIAKELSGCLREIIRIEKCCIGNVGAIDNEEKA